MLLSFINKALPILIQGFGASLVPISLFTADDIYTAVSPTVDLPMNSILYSTTIKDSNLTSQRVRLGALPLKLARGYKTKFYILTNKLNKEHLLYA